MNKHEEDKLANAIITLHQEIKKQGESLAKLNLSIGELRLSYMKLDASLNRYAKSNESRLNEHESRIVRLEKTSGSSYLQEPRGEYKKKKKK